jgi:hypothetical protein
VRRVCVHAHENSNTWFVCTYGQYMPPIDVKIKLCNTQNKHAAAAAATDDDDGVIWSLTLSRALTLFFFDLIRCACKRGITSLREISISVQRLAFSSLPLAYVQRSLFILFPASPPCVRRTSLLPYSIFLLFHFYINTHWL